MPSTEHTDSARAVTDPAAAPVGLLPGLGPDHVYLREHRVRGRRILPGVVTLDLALRAAQRAHPDRPARAIADAAWLRPVDGESPLDDLELRLDELAPRGSAKYTLTHAGQLCALGTLLPDPPVDRPAVPLEVRDAVAEHTDRHITRHEIYAAFAEMGVDYGPYFRRISYVQRRDWTALAWLTGNDGPAMDRVNLLDCAFQVGMAISIGEHRDGLLPFSMGLLVLHRPVPPVLRSAFVLTVKHTPFRTGLTIYDDDFAPLISVFDLGVKPAP